MTMCLRGRCLPDGIERVVFVDGDNLTFEPVAGAELVHEGGWLIPGLVDVHTHPGAQCRVNRSTTTCSGGSTYRRLDDG